MYPNHPAIILVPAFDHKARCVPRAFAQGSVSGSVGLKVQLLSQEGMQRECALRWWQPMTGQLWWQCVLCETR